MRQRLPIACAEYFEKFSEFRGHSQVTETGPGGKKTITTFHQGDILKGRPISTTIQSASSSNLTQTKYFYGSVSLPMVDRYCCVVGSAYVGIDRYWVYTSAQENWVYGQSGATVGATRTEFYYDETAMQSSGQFGNLTTQKEYSRSGTNWALYREIETYYEPNTNAPYLVSLPLRIRTLDATGAVLASTLYFYDGNTGSYLVAPTVRKLTATRTRVSVDGLDWSQVSYGYDDWGNRTTVTAYSDYGPFNANPPAASARMTTTVYDPIPYLPDQRDHAAHVQRSSRANNYLDV